MFSTAEQRSRYTTNTNSRITLKATILDISLGILTCLDTPVTPNYNVPTSHPGIERLALLPRADEIGKWLNKQST
jgi:hypothetical protein